MLLLECCAAPLPVQVGTLFLCPYRAEGKNFHDDDWQNDGDCTKIWDYMTHHYLSLEEDTAASLLA